MFFFPKKTRKKKRVFVGVSGGVDSSVTAAILKKEGYEVIGVFIRTWQPDWLPCTWREERRDAIRVCSQLDIPFFELNLEDEYKKGVVDYMIAEYEKGKTPNPDVMCNREVKFGAFFRWAMKHGADFVATGHYAQVKKEKDTYLLLRGKDKNKDQSYFLWTLGQEELSNTLFPIGSFEKPQVRRIAKSFGLSTAPKPDSQGICFLGDIDMKDFLKHYIQTKEGNVLDENGNVIGKHDGVFFLTLGERHGFNVEKKNTDGGAYYIIAKDIEENTITVSQNPLIHNKEIRNLTLHSVNDIYALFREGMELSFQIRYRGKLHYAQVIGIDSQKKTMELLLEQNDYTISPGQSIVFYDGDICLGGAIVEY